MNVSQTNFKIYWSILKKKNNCVNIPVIPPLLEKSKLIKDFELKENLFNDFSVNNVLQQITEVQLLRT